MKLKIGENNYTISEWEFLIFKESIESEKEEVDMDLTEINKIKSKLEKRKEHLGRISYYIKQLEINNTK